jgi:aldehyde dehydrogenase (NAD+)
MIPTPLDDIPGVVARARQVFLGGRTRPVEWRIGQLQALRAALREDEAKILEALHADLGKSGFEGWLGEVNFLVNEATHAIENLPAWSRPERVATPLFLRPGRCKIHREPLGVALIIGPWNYPLQLMLSPLIGAIAAGNAAVLKPSEVAAETSQLLAELIARHLDADAFATVQGGAVETSRLLEQKFDHVFYTGNAAVGRIVMQAAALHLTPVTLELGGKSPCIVDRSANMNVALRRIVWGKFFNAGQSCVAPDYALVHRDVASEFVDGVRATIERFYGRDPKDSADYARIVNERHVDRLAALLEEGDVVCGGEIDRSARYVAPTVLRGVSPGGRVMEDEIFGPILPILEVTSVDDAIAFVNDRPKPLALYVFADDRDVQERVLAQTSSGGGCVNDTLAHLGAPGLPFGGVGGSGMGAYHGRHGFETFTHRKGVLHKSTLIDIPLRYPPYDATKIRWTRRLA